MRSTEVNKTVLIVIGVVVVLLLALPALSALKSGAGHLPVPSSSNGDAPAAAGEAAQPAVALQPPLLNAGNLVGSAWSVKGFTISLGAGGVASAQTPIGQVQGTWVVEGANLTVKAMGRTAVGQISGDQILIDGQPIQRVQ
jgi:hypothetical protein